MFTDLDITTEYRSGINNVIKDFYIPTLLNAVKYKRAVGFFSSTALIEISKGIMGLIANNGTIDLIVSPRLSEEDIEAMKIGYSERDKIIENAILRDFTEPKNYFEEERLNILANLIAEGKLNIKVAFTTNHNQLGIYHEKMGIMYDLNDNVIAFSGSTNETEAAFVSNYEVLDVFCSWQSEFELKKIIEKETAFHRLWTNADSSVVIIDFPNVAKEKLQQYKKDKIDLEIDKKEIDFNEKQQDEKNKQRNIFTKPESLIFHKYQEEAIEGWIEANGRGIFDMATGTGKTLTALGAITKLSELVNHNIFVVIICPQTHLIEQWIDDIKYFGVEPLVAYSAYSWKEELKKEVRYYNNKIKRSVCVITTNSSFILPDLQNQLLKVKDNLCIVVDEAHNFGSKNQRKYMSEIFKYRLGLSATLERHHDEDGTQALYNFFGQPCIHYSLERAIAEDKLCKYNYYPIVVSLEEDELEAYNIISEKISNILSKYNKRKSDDLPEIVKTLLIKRSRIISGARNKIKALYEEMKKHTKESNILVYCGATKVPNINYLSQFDYEYEYDNEEFDGHSERQINIVADMLGNKLGMRVRRFTSTEDKKERDLIKKDFAEGKMLQCIVAIKCLDEGLNIPGIKTAFILASSTNPKEYIQRRGRVLRKADGKFISNIYDFITLPHDLDSEFDLTNSRYELSLIKREFERMNDFAKLSENSSRVDKLAKKIDEKYNLNIIGDENDEW